MFNTLVESRPVRQRRVGGSLVSVVAHALVVVALVGATARGAMPPASEAPRERLVFRPPPVDPPPATVAPSADTRATTAPSAPTHPAIHVPTIDIPTIVPTSIPELPGPKAIPSEWSAERVRSGAGGAGGVPGGRGTMVGDVGAVFAEHHVDRPVVLAPGARGPAYPEVLRSAGIDGGVIAQFIVDTTGRVEEGSLRVLHTDHPAFADAVRRSLPGMRFLPAEAAGRKVRQLVQLPFKFDLSRFDLD